MDFLTEQISEEGFLSPNPTVNRIFLGLKTMTEETGRFAPGSLARTFVRLGGIF